MQLHKSAVVYSDNTMFIRASYRLNAFYKTRVYIEFSPGWREVRKKITANRRNIMPEVIHKLYIKKYHEWQTLEQKNGNKEELVKNAWNSFP